MSLSSVATTPVTVEYATSDGSAYQPQDYALTSGSLTFAPGETWKTVDVPVKGNRTFEADEIFAFDLANAAGAALLTPSGAGTILDDDRPALTVSTSDAQVREGDAGDLRRWCSSFG